MNDRILRPVVTLLIGLFVVYYWITHPGSLLSYLLVGAVVGIVLLSKPVWLLQGALLSGAMELLLPGFGGTLGLQHFFFGLLAAYGVIHAAIEKDQRMRLSSRFLLGFGLVLVVIVLVRGIGFRVFGSEAFGGSDYVKLFLAIGGYWGGIKVQMRPSQLRRTMVLYALAPVVPLLAQTLMAAHPQLFGILGRFIETRAHYVLSEETLYGFRGVMGGVGGRLHAAGSLATGLWFVLWLRYGLRRYSHRWILYVGLIAAVALASLSGFRGTTAGIALFGALCLWLTSRNKALLTTIGVGTLAVGTIMLVAIGPRLPLNIQRAFSFVPIVQWDPTVRRDAENSASWRLKLWRYAAPNVPKYLLIGRGLLLEDVFRRHAWRSWHYYSTPEFFYATHSYHSGPLSLLLDTGVPGLIMFLGFQVSVVWEAWRNWRYRSRWGSDPFLQAGIFYFAVRATYQLVGYYLLYGDIKYNLIDWVVTGLWVRNLGGVIEETASQADRQRVHARRNDIGMEAVPAPWRHETVLGSASARISGSS